MARAAAIPEPNLPWVEQQEDRSFRWIMIITLLLFLGAGIVLNAIKLPEIVQKNLVDISPRLARVIRRMGRCERSRRYRNWDECLLDLMLVEKGNPPLAAQLSEALGTDRIEDDQVVDPPPPDDFSQDRLRRRGMTVRRTVLTIYLCTAGTAIGASLLPHVRDNAGAVLVAAQTAVFLLVIALLEKSGAKP